MILKVINSNSAGNAYILENEEEALLIECGVKFDKIMQALAFNLQKVKGAIVTHEHNDHSKAMRKVLENGIEVWTTRGTHYACGTDQHHRARFISSKQEVQIGNFRVMAFSIKHDAADPVGFLINHSETGTVLFLTDSYYSEYTFSGLNNVIIEANYSQQILQQKLDNGYVIPYLRNRIIKSHMNIETCQKLLQANDLSKVNNILLIHLSDSNSDAKLFREIITAATGKNVTIAESGLSIPFNKNPF